MWFGILGPLLIRDRDTALDVPAARQRVLLAALLVHAGRPVPADTLAEVMWDGKPPAGAVTTLRSHVMRLRRVLGPVVGSRVVTRYPGYLVEAADQEVDLLRFTWLCRQGGAAVRAGAWARAQQLLDEALGSWRGEPLMDVPSGLLHRDEVPRLEQLRLQALEWRIGAGLHLGCHGELVPELQSLVAQHPLRERFHVQLMLALYRCSRPAEALAAYQDARRALVAELGTEPGPELRVLHRRILNDDPALAVRGTAPPAAAANLVVPRQLPAKAPYFTGRAAELTVLTGLLSRPAGERPATVVISATDGMAGGVGKTALAVHWAHRVAERFPDGQLYVNLRGSGPGGPPVPAAEAVLGFIQAMRDPGQPAPAGLPAQVALYRSLVADRCMLVVLDNARDEEQVRPLLPGGPACFTVITSRNLLMGLVTDGAAHLAVGRLSSSESLDLLARRLGRQRLESEAETVRDLVAGCAGLPLALCIVAARAAVRPDLPLAVLPAALPPAS